MMKFTFRIFVIGLSVTVFSWRQVKKRLLSADVSTKVSAISKDSDITHLLKSEEVQNSEWFSSFFWKEINLTATLFHLNLIDDRFPHGCTLR